MLTWWSSYQPSDPTIPSVTHISAQQQLLYHHHESHRDGLPVFRTGPTVICANAHKMTAQDIDAMSSRSAFTEGLAAVQGWKTKHYKSTISTFTNIQPYTEVQGVGQIHDQISKSDSDIQSVILSLWYWVSDIESLTLSLWHWVTDINWHRPDKH